MDINGNITQVSATGNYFVTFPTIGLPTETNYIILMTVSVSIGTETYTYALPLIANVFVIKYQPAVTVPTNVQIVEEGGTVTIPISVIDTHLNSNFTAIKIDWIVYDASNILQITGTITQVNTGGNYFISFSVANLAPDAIYHVVIAVNVTANNVEYKYDATILSVNINVQYTTILGIPRPYFWIMMVAVIGLVGTLVIYRSVKYARIPQFIRDIQRARTTIRKGKSAGRENITETRGESISKSLEARYAVLGISPVEKYAPKSSADAGKTGGERNPEKEVA
jgi:hypothetical protein